MKKIYSLFALLVVGIAFSSCNNFLDCSPEDFGDETSYFRNPNDLKMSVNTFYSILPRMKENNTGVYSEDNLSDNQMGTGPNAMFYPGDKRTVQQGSSEWKFENLRGINFFINKAEEKKAEGSLTGSIDLINHYIGEGYFFRAYDYFRLLTNYGDVPILTKMVPDNPSLIADLTKRKPRNEVARFILSDLDKAIEMMLSNAPESGRVTKDAALVFKARVALYEATWEKYHAGTCFVPGNEKWVGNGYTENFSFPAGSAEAEINFFLDEAIQAAEQVASTRSLDNNYIAMFNSLKEFPNTSEVILARYYKSSVITHSCSNYLGRTGAGTGITRALANSYLTKNGLPIYANNNDQYKGDLMPFYEMINRDERFSSSIKGGGLIYKDEEQTDTLAYFLPQVTQTGAESATTGYQINKWVSYEEGQDVYTQGTSATPIFRAAEAYITYIEAYYERYGRLDDKCDTYWRALRRRAGVEENYQVTIDNTDLALENDLATKWKGAFIDPTLYNIRRERRCEFIAEGLRFNDLRRWRALDNMVNYQIEGINLWEWMHTLYKKGSLAEGIVSQAGVSNYLRPLQRVATSSAYFGYNFPKPHYLEPIPISEFILNTDKLTGKSTLYQNPGWPSDADGTADYSYDCD